MSISFWCRSGKGVFGSAVISNGPVVKSPTSSKFDLEIIRGSERPSTAEGSDIFDDRNGLISVPSGFVGNGP